MAASHASMSHDPQQLCSCQLLGQQQLKDGISSSAVIPGLYSMISQHFFPFRPFNAQNSVHGNVGMWLELVVCACREGGGHN